MEDVPQKKPTAGQFLRSYYVFFWQGWIFFKEPPPNIIIFLFRTRVYRPSTPDCETTRTHGKNTQSEPRAIFVVEKGFILSFAKKFNQPTRNLTTDNHNPVSLDLGLRKPAKDIPGAAIHSRDDIPAEDPLAQGHALAMPTTIIEQYNLPVISLVDRWSGISGGPIGPLWGGSPIPRDFPVCPN